MLRPRKPSRKPYHLVVSASGQRVLSKWWVKYLLWGLFGFYGLLLLVGELLSHAVHRPVGPAPTALNARTVSIPYERQQLVKAWLSPGNRGKGMVLLVHGIRVDRRAMYRRGYFLHQQGYGVLLMDLPAHGESTGQHITFGMWEARGVRAAIDYLHQQYPHEKIGVLGVSLGAASVVMAHPKVEAIVLDSMFASLDDAITNRMRIYLGEPAYLYKYLLSLQMPLRFGIWSSSVSPVTHLKHIHAPVMIIAGDQDRHVLPAETYQIYRAVQGPGELWWVKGAGHEDLYQKSPEEYGKKIDRFFQRYLAGVSARSSAISGSTPL